MIKIRIPSKYKARCYKCFIDLVCEPCDIERAEEEYDILEWGVSKGKAVREIEFINCPICNRKLNITPENVVEYADITPEEYNTIKNVESK